MDKVISETKVTDCFQERDLRVKIATDSNNIVGSFRTTWTLEHGNHTACLSQETIVIEPLKKGRGT